MAAADLAAMASFLIWSALLALDCFCEDFFWLDFGDLSPMILFFFYRVDCLRHVIFSAGGGIVRALAVNVNARWEFILAGKGSRSGVSPSRDPKIVDDSCCYPAGISQAAPVC